MKTVFITSFHPLISRNIIATNIPQMLVWGGFRIVVLVPNFKVAYFQKIYGSLGIVFEGVEIGVVARGKLVGIFKRWAEAAPHTKRAAIGRTRTLSGGKKTKIYYYLFYLPASWFGRFLFFHKIMRFVDYYLSPKGKFYGILEKYNPDIIFTTDIQNEHDVALMQDARRKGIKIISMVRSWDNLTTRALRFMPDKIVVHNEIIKKEATTIHGVSLDKIVVTGTPHYDKYVKGPTMRREDFFCEIGIDLSKKLIVYIPLCDYRLLKNDVDKYVIEILAGLNHNLAIRFPPAETVNIGEFKKPANVIFDRPGYVFHEEVVGNRDLTPEDDERYINLLAYCDLIIGGPSTFVIDAALFDKPIVLVDFYPREVVEDEKIYEYGAEHFERILETGGAKHAKTKDEFLKFIDEYLKNPSLDRVGRERIVRDQIGRTDGRASERVVNFLISNS